MLRLFSIGLTRREIRNIATRQLTFRLRVDHLARDAVRAKPATFAENQEPKAPAATRARDGTF
jgi:hypothetical protein